MFFVRNVGKCKVLSCLNNVKRWGWKFYSVRNCFDLEGIDVYYKRKSGKFIFIRKL